MPKSAIIGSVVLALALVLIVIWAAVQPQPAVAPTNNTTLVLPSGKYTDETQFYKIAANYPTSTPLSASIGAEADAAAIAKIHSMIIETIMQFKTDGNFDKLTAEDIKMLGFSDARKESLQITYLIAPSSPRVISYIFTTYEDTFGAHPNGFFNTLSFDLKTGNQLALSDLFVNGSDYLGTLSTLSRQMLPSVIGKDADLDYIKTGTTPDAKNFQNFFFDNNDFVIVFPPYQVGPYAIGPQTLRIPKTKLSSILKPEYQ